MKYYIAYREEFSGYECDGHMQTYIVAANNEQEVFELLDDRSDWDKKNNKTPNIDTKMIKLLDLPNLFKRKKPFIFI